MSQVLIPITVLATVLSCLVSATAAADDLRVMSFNIRFGTANDGKDAWPNRKELVQKTIAAYQPDLLGTQETLPFQAEFLKQQLNGFEYFGWSRDTNVDGEQCGIFVKKERFEVLDSGQFWLSETPDIKASKSWDSSLPRVATWVRLKDRNTGDREFFFANTHFDHRGSEARLKSAQLIRTRLSQLASGLPIVLTGDFNCDEGSEPWKEIMQDKLLKDTWREVFPQKNASEGTFSGFTGKAGDARIDWILASQHFDAKESAIDRTNDNGRYPSDHFPVTATLNWSSK